jgi:hypothetical protein
MRRKPKHFGLSPELLGPLVPVCITTEFLLWEKTRKTFLIFFCDSACHKRACTHLLHKFKN